ncbi:predicted protein [Plenodomus lingam JN3]|uniref:Predicted protein n=1 Tax=Leptosphaeria maculans (strain JN3 / isolate v23.1.3 / race Av1-4-5-6-7-8) TaxID=985895 RepID=E5R456_LEPMJ|nr:predicted protein [Plenodomus lingam JN3]CBX91787.1 predicted protein [Plenodomus lingam JN3]
MSYSRQEKRIQTAYDIHATYVLFIDGIVHEMGDALDELEVRLCHPWARRSF